MNYQTVITFAFIGLGLIFFRKLIVSSGTEDIYGNRLKKYSERQVKFLEFFCLLAGILFIVITVLGLFKVL